MTEIRSRKSKTRKRRKCSVHLCILRTVYNHLVRQQEETNTCRRKDTDDLLKKARSHVAHKTNCTLYNNFQNE